VSAESGQVEGKGKGVRPKKPSTENGKYLDGMFEALPSTRKIKDLPQNLRDHLQFISTEN